MNEILPCPFCGTYDGVQHKDDCWFTLNAIEASRGKLRLAWNRRATPPATPANPPAEADKPAEGLSAEDRETLTQAAWFLDHNYPGTAEKVRAILAQQAKGEKK